MGRVKGQTSIKLLRQFHQLRKKPYWGNHFCARGYCVDTVGMDADMIRKYGNVSPGELAQIIEGLNEIIGS